MQTKKQEQAVVIAYIPFQSLGQDVVMKTHDKKEIRKCTSYL